MNNKLTPREREHLHRVKSLPCGCCGQAGPSQAHHIEQGAQYTAIPLCPSCHTDPHNGLHGQKAMWKVMKKTEMSVLDDTIRRLMP